MILTYWPGAQVTRGRASMPAAPCLSAGVPPACSCNPRKPSMRHRPFFVALTLVLCSLLAPDRAEQSVAHSPPPVTPSAVPYAYLFPPEFTQAVGLLQRRGLEV